MLSGLLPVQVLESLGSGLVVFNLRGLKVDTFWCFIHDYKLHQQSSQICVHLMNLVVLHAVRDVSEQTVYKARSSALCIHYLLSSCVISMY